MVPIIDSFNSSEKDVDQSFPEAFNINESLQLMNAFDGKKTIVKLSDYKYAIVMALADRTLDVSWCIGECAYYDENPT